MLVSAFVDVFYILLCLKCDEALTFFFENKNGLKQGISIFFPT